MVENRTSIYFFSINFAVHFGRKWRNGPFIWMLMFNIYISKDSNIKRADLFFEDAKIIELLDFIKWQYAA